MTGEVTKIDPQKGTVTMKTETGTFALHFPAAFLQNVKQGGQITVEMGLSDADAGAASARAGRRARQDRSGTKK